MRYYLGRSPRNPYALPHRKRPWGRWFFLCATGFVAGFGILMFSTMFAITEIRIEGATSSEEGISAAVQTELSEWSRLLTFRTADVKRRLLEGELALESVEIEKDYPHTLIVRVVERTPRVVWQTAERAWLVDQNGHKVGEWALDKPREPNLTYFFDESGAVPSNTETIELSRFTILLELQEQLKKNGIEVLFIKLESPASPFVKYVTSEGWELYLDLANDTGAQLDKLNAVLTNLGDQRHTIKYLDVRFADRVYYQ